MSSAYEQPSFSMKALTVFITQRCLLSQWHQSQQSRLTRQKAFVKLSGSKALYVTGICLLSALPLTVKAAGNGKTYSTFWIPFMLNLINSGIMLIST